MRLSISLQVTTQGGSSRCRGGAKGIDTGEEVIKVSLISYVRSQFQTK